MAIVRTVNGGIDPDQLGICYPHEHLMGQPPPQYSEPDFVLNDEAASAKALHALRSAGGNALVEMTPIDYHRNPAALQRISSNAEVHVIAVTGFLKAKFSEPFVRNETVDTLTARFIREIEHGMDGGNIRAGVIKASSSLNAITASERKVFMAAAQAQRATGALISTHTEAGTMGLEQIDLLTDQGVAPNRILVGHLDHNLQPDYHLKIAQRGVYMGFDQIGKVKYAPDAERVALIKRLINAGYEKQLMLSMDIARRSYLPAYGGSPGFEYLLNKFVPMLGKAGVPPETIDVIIKANPARALSMERKTA